MSALYGKLKGNRGEVTRVGSNHIEASLGTLNEGGVRVMLYSNWQNEMWVKIETIPWLEYDGRIVLIDKSLKELQQ